jgi:hypothetical protein
MTDATTEGTTAPAAPPAPAADPPIEGTAQAERGLLGMPQSELASARAAWIDAGHDPEKFDAAARAEGLDPTPPDMKVSKHYEEHALPEAPAAQDYRVSWHSLNLNLPAERIAGLNSQLTEWAAAMGLSAPIGVGIIERIAQLGPALRDMTPAAREIWANEQQAMALRHAGSEEALTELRQRAVATLKIAGNVGKFKEGAFSQILENSTVFNDVWLLRTLANHSRAVEAFASSHPHDKKK